VAKLQIGIPTEDPNVMEWVDLMAEDIVIELEIDTSKFDDAMASLALDGRTNPCQVFCQRHEDCKIQCLGEDPHAEGFGPFHVFPEHHRHDHYSIEGPTPTDG